MKLKFIVIIAILVIAAAGLVWKSRIAKAPIDQPLTVPQGDIVVTSPTANQIISSPLEISGKAKGGWFFEATFPVKLLDENGNILASGTVRAQGDWQTADYVNFSGSLSFKTPTSTRGSLQLSKDNPSDLPENDEFYFVPVNFNKQTSQQPSGTCAPDLENCNGDAKLCMEESKNATCN